MNEPTRNDSARKLAVIAGACVLVLAAIANWDRIVAATHRETGEDLQVRLDVQRAPLTMCVNRGIAYFKEAGSYPKLTDGRSAEDAANEQCGRSTNAFK